MSGIRSQANRPNVYAMAALKRAYGERLGRGADLLADRSRIALDLHHLGVVLRMFDPAVDLAAIKPIRPELAKRHVKAELKRADVGYVELARRLSEMGLAETEGSITTKINRGAYPAWWLFAVMRAIGAHTLRLE